MLASYGITAIVEPGSQMGRVTRVYQEAYDGGPLPIRVTVYDGWYRSGDSERAAEIRRKSENVWWLWDFTTSATTGSRCAAPNRPADGGMGSRSAALSAPFLTIPEDPLGEENFGTYRDPDTDYRLRQFRPLADYGWEIHTHACGDAAIRQTIDVYEMLMDAILARDPEVDLRWSIIHCYLPDEPKTSVIEEMAGYGIIAAINPANLYFEGDSFVRNIGPERMGRHTPYRTFLDAGIVMASGSDYPNNSPDPWIGMYQMVTRKHQISGEVHGPEQRLSFPEALQTFTRNGAYLTFDEDVRGRSRSRKARGSRRSRCRPDGRRAGGAPDDGGGTFLAQR